MAASTTERSSADLDRQRWDWELFGWIATAALGLATALIGSVHIRLAVVAYWPDVLSSRTPSSPAFSPPLNSVSTEATLGAWMLGIGVSVATVASGARLLRTRWPWLFLRSILALTMTAVVLLLLGPLLQLLFEYLVGPGSIIDQPPGYTPSPPFPSVFQACSDVESLALILGGLAFLVNLAFALVGLKRSRSYPRAKQGDSRQGIRRSINA